MQYKIYAALKEDIDSGLVWIVSPQVDQRPIVCIKNKTTGKKVYCEALRIEPNFERIYECGRTLKLDTTKNPLVINEWYRKKLNLSSTKANEDLEITVESGIKPRLYAVFQHPQLVVRVACTLGVISVVLGILGIILGAISLCRPNQ